MAKTQLKTPAYVEEFRRWRDASPASRWRVLWEQAKHGIEPGPDLLEPVKCKDLEMIRPNGKRLMECSSEDFRKIHEWHRAIRIAKRAYE
jgi:hypothetical protein